MSVYDPEKWIKLETVEGRNETMEWNEFDLEAFDFYKPYSFFTDGDNLGYITPTPNVSFVLVQLVLFTAYPFSTHDIHFTFHSFRMDFLYERCHLIPLTLAIILVNLKSVLSRDPLKLVDRGLGIRSRNTVKLKRDLMMMWLKSRLEKILQFFVHRRGV